MITKDNIIDFSGQTIFIGLDVHKRSWKSTFSTNHTIQKTVLIEKPFSENLAKYLHRHYPKANYNAAYEAGFSGFWAQEQLESQGIKTIIVNPADIPTTDKERKSKNDKRDSRKISVALRSGELQGIYIPSKIAQKDRSLVRERESLARSQRRVKNQIKSHLLFYGIELPEDFPHRYWSKRMVSWLERISQDRNDEALKLKIQRHLLLRTLDLSALRQLRLLARQEKYNSLYRLLDSVPGVGLLTNMLLISEIIVMKRFKSEDQLFSYAGFIPTTHSSGESEKVGEMTMRGNRRLRTALVESSWVAIRHDQELLIKYENYRKRMGGQKAIVKIARLLLRRIRQIWLNQEPYRKVEIK